MEARGAEGFGLQHPRRGMLRQRVISSLILLPLLLAAIWFSSLWFSLVVALAAILGLIEFYRLARQGGGQPLAPLGILLSLLLLFHVYREGSHNALSLGGAVVLALIILSFQAIIYHQGFGKTILNATWTLGGIFYVGLLLGFWIMLWDTFGREWTLLAMLSAFSVDTGAFFVGRRFGRHRMAPKISPKKTWEGAIGGLFCCVAAIVLLAFLFKLIGKPVPEIRLDGPMELGQVIGLGVLVGILAQVGDLAESKLKRSVDAKDASTLIPGHGGLLDRLDSLLVVGVLVYSYIAWIR